MKIIPIPALEDNYSYILIDEKTKEAAVIDPVEPIKVLNVISQTGAKLSRYGGCQVRGVDAMPEY